MLNVNRGNTSEKEKKEGGGVVSAGARNLVPCQCLSVQATRRLASRVLILDAIGTKPSINARRPPST